jgi:hypothetical protein
MRGINCLASNTTHALPLSLQLHGEVEVSRKETNMSNASFVSANALRSAVIPSAHTTHKSFTWHTAKPAFYAAFYAGYEANGGSIE